MPSHIPPPKALVRALLERIPKGVCLVLPALLLLSSAQRAVAKIDLTTLSTRNTVQTTIYKAADLALVRDGRTFHFAKGNNRIQISWANTRIDPTSLALEIKDPSLPLRIRQLQFPPNAQAVAVWHIEADKACRADVDITYFTSGLSWQAYYTAFLSRDRSRLSLNGYVKVENQSGEDYADAQTRLVVGRIHVLDRIADLASRPFPYGKPDIKTYETRRDTFAKGRALLKAAPAMIARDDLSPPSPKKIAKQRISEYFLYTIDGTETIAHGWAKRLISFRADDIPVENRYVYEPDRFGDQVVHMLTFKNDPASGLGRTPLPGGGFKVFRRLDPALGLAYLGAASSKYIPLGRQVRLNLGPTPRVTVEPRVTGYEKTRLLFDKKGNLKGYDEVRNIAVEAANFTGAPALVEMIETKKNLAFEISDVRCSGQFEQIDRWRFKFVLTLKPGARERIQYTLTTFKGDRKWRNPSK